MVHQSLERHFWRLKFLVLAGEENKNKEFGRYLSSFKLKSEVCKWLAGGFSALLFFTYDKIECRDYRLWEASIAIGGIFLLFYGYMVHQRKVIDMELELEAAGESGKSGKLISTIDNKFEYPTRGKFSYALGTFCLVAYAFMFFYRIEFRCPKKDKCCCDKTAGVDTLIQKPCPPIDSTRPIVLHNVHFDTDKANIRDDAKPDLNNVANMMQFRPGRIIELSAHTDSTANDEYNMSLSKRRADSAKAYLTNQKDISPERIIAIGYGEKHPRYPNSMPGGMDSNRRVEFKIIKE